MARKPTSREYFLIGVLAVAGIVALYVGRGGGFNLGGEAGASKGEPLSIGEGPQVHMERLTQRAEAYDPRARNLFAYWTPPPPPPPKLASRPKPKPVVTLPKPKPPPPPPRTNRPRGPRPPGIAFTYLGNLGPKNNRIAVFEQGDGEMMLARAGETVRKHFRVVRFGYEAVVMGYTDERFKDRTTELPMRPK